MKKISIFLLFLFLICSGCKDDKAVRIVNASNREFLVPYFDALNLDYKLTDNIIYIENTAESLQVLIDLYNILNLKGSVITENIINSKVTRTDEGGCYLRKIVVIDSKGVPRIEIDKTTPVKLVYDPTHPDSVKEGLKKGYIEYPNVDIQSEYADLLLLQTEIETVRTILLRMDSELIIPEYDWVQSAAVFTGIFY